MVDRNSDPNWENFPPGSYDGLMLRVASIILAILAGATAIRFIALYLGGYPSALAHERLALAPLIAGLGAAVVEGYRRGRLTRPIATLGVTLLAVWVIFLRFQL
jgi:hypothetical protein